MICKYNYHNPSRVLIINRCTIYTPTKPSKGYIFICFKSMSENYKLIERFGYQFNIKSISKRLKQEAQLLFNKQFLCAGFPALRDFYKINSRVEFGCIYMKILDTNWHILLNFPRNHSSIDV